MATYFKNEAVKEIGTVPVRIIQNDASTKSIVLGISLANLTEVSCNISILLHDETSVQAYYMKDVPIPPNTSLKVISGGEKLILEPYNELYIVSDETESIDAIVSYVDVL